MFGILKTGTDRDYNKDEWSYISVTLSEISVLGVFLF